ncbi:hypothetical protein ENUP19_0278G0048 [Entamoeba nuttalli]
MKSIGINPVFICYMESMKKVKLTNDIIKKIEIHKKYYYFIILYEIIHEKNIIQIINEMGISRGVLQQLQNNTITTLNMIIQFSNELHNFDLSFHLKVLIDRIKFGVCSDIVHIIQIDGITKEIARKLIVFGFNDISKIAHASFLDIFSLIHHLSTSHSLSQLQIDLELTQRIIQSAQEINTFNLNHVQLNNLLQSN